MLIEPSEKFYAVFCDDSDYSGQHDYLLCGVLSTRKEAEELAEHIKDCPLKHTIKKVSVSVEW